MMKMPCHAVVIVGSSSTIASWIREYYSNRNIKIFTMSRHNNSDYTYESILDLSLFLNIFLGIVKSGYTIDEIYYCPGHIAKCSVAKISLSEWNKAFEVNLHGFLCIYQALLASSESLSSTKLIVTGSTAVVSLPKHNVAYSCSKIALETLITFINNEPPSSVRACCVRLGSCQTNFANNLNKVNLIRKEDFLHLVNLIHEIRAEVLPELLVIRPINQP